MKEYAGLPTIVFIVSMTFLVSCSDGLSPEKKAEIQQLTESLQSQHHLDTLFKESYDFIKIGKEEQVRDELELLAAREPRRPELHADRTNRAWSCRPARSCRAALRPV